jgi:LacI family transcriptional regulator
MKRVTVKDLAKELDVSLGTINKALNNKPGLSDETRKRILKAADNLGYKVNRVAQSLARSTIRVGIIIPDVWLEYYTYLKEGINQELDRLSDFNIQGKYYTVSSLHSGKESITALNDCVRDGMDAVILCPLYHADYSSSLNDLYQKKIPVVVLGSDIREANKLCSVRVDAYKAGRLAAEFMGWISAKEKPIAVFIGNKDFSDHKDKVDGFLDESKKQPYGMVSIFETHDDPEIAHFMTNKLVRETSDLGGIYIATGNSISVCKYLSENNIKNVRIIVTDVFKEMIGYVKQNIIQGMIFQDQIAQGGVAVRVIYDKLVRNIVEKETIFIQPQIVLRNNFEGYFKYLKVE